MTAPSLSASNRAADPPRITSLACPTRGRVRLLHRALASYAEALARHSREVEVVVSDDAPGEAPQRSAREMLRGLRARFGVRTRYAGTEARKAFATDLARASGVRADVVLLALLGLPDARVSTGANRNTLLLDTVGERILSVDDDTICLAASPPGAEAGLTFLSEDRFSSSHPADVWPFRDLDAALATLEVRDIDPLAAHERFLGLPLASCLAVAERDGEFRDDPAGRPVLDSETRGTIRATVNGLAGEHTWPSAMGYLLLTGASFERLTESRARYRDALAGRCIVKAVRRTTIVDRCHHAPALFLGLDNRTVLPPFFPVGRGQDILWWEALARGCPGARIAQLPLVMLHAPARRRNLPGVLRTVSRLPLNRVIAALMPEDGTPGTAWAPWGGESEEGAAGPDRLRRLGSRLVTLGRLPAREFADLASRRIRRELEVLFQQVERRIDQEGKGRGFWRDDVARLLWIARRALAGDWVIVPHDLDDTGTTGGGRERIQRLVLGYGEVLLAWPDLVEATRELAARGRRVGTEV